MVYGTELHAGCVKRMFQLEIYRFNLVTNPVSSA